MGGGGGGGGGSGGKEDEEEDEEAGGNNPSCSAGRNQRDAPSSQVNDLTGLSSGSTSK